jgi:hypothetical protein
MEAVSRHGRLQMEVGIEDCLHIEFEYGRGAYHLQDVVVGKIYFLLVRIKLKHMELEVRRRETAGGGAAARAESDTVAKFEIMDGAPVRGEVIPIRLHLSPYDLTPTYFNVHNKFSVKVSARTRAPSCIRCRAWPSAEQGGASPFGAFGGSSYRRKGNRIKWAGSLKHSRLRSLQYMLTLVLVDDEDRRYFKQQEIVLYRLPEGAEVAGGAWAVLTPRTAARTLAGGGGGDAEAGGSGKALMGGGSEGEGL